MKNEDGEGSNPSATNRDGNADMGVSMLLLLLLYDWPCEGPPGGCGRANGFGGPDAPALRIALALGDGGGKTTPVPEE